MGRTYFCAFPPSPRPGVCAHAQMRKCGLGLVGLSGETEATGWESSRAWTRSTLLCRFPQLPPQSRVCV